MYRQGYAMQIRGFADRWGGGGTGTLHVKVESGDVSGRGACAMQFDMYCRATELLFYWQGWEEYMSWGGSLPWGCRVCCCQEGYRFVDTLPRVLAVVEIDVPPLKSNVERPIVHSAPVPRQRKERNARACFDSVPRAARAAATGGSRTRRSFDACHHA